MIPASDPAWADVSTPTLVVRPEVARANIARMAAKARASGVRFRPHFKTHNSPEVGRWFAEVGVDAITVSSVAMAERFAAAGWRDLTVAFPVNVRELAALDALARRVTLGVLVERAETALRLASETSSPMQVWLELDTGYQRSGLPWDDQAGLLALARAVQSGAHLHLAGLLTHAGHSYRARGREAILAVHEETCGRLLAAKEVLGREGVPVEVSLGDTPCCSVATSFKGVDEVRPGNFVFYDVQQKEIGSCTPKGWALAVACPVVATYPDRGEVVVYGGAVHLSKDFTEVGGVRRHGAVLGPDWRPLEGAYVSSLSQEHGLVRLPAELQGALSVGDLLLIVPAHACLAVQALGRFRTLSGQYFN